MIRSESSKTSNNSHHDVAASTSCFSRVRTPVTGRILSNTPTRCSARRVFKNSLNLQKQATILTPASPRLPAVPNSPPRPGRPLLPPPPPPLRPAPRRS